jgi:hypothetical protein
MAIGESAALEGATRPQTEAAPATIITTGAARFLAVFRVVLGFEFLWAFLDKTFGQPDDGVDVGGGVAAGQGDLGRGALDVDQPDRRLPHHLRPGADRAGGDLRRQHLGLGKRWAELGFVQRHRWLI